MQLKRILAILLAAALIFSIPTVSVGAENTEIFEVGVVAETTSPVSTSPAIYQTGDEVSVKVSAVQNTGVDIIKFKICYDRDVLEYVDYTSYNLFNNETITPKNDPDSDYIIYNILLNGASTATGDILTVNFKVKDTFCGNADVSVELFAGRPANCKNGANNVPFVGATTSFAAHSIDTAAGVVTAPTCEDEGYTTYTCDICGESIVGNTVAPNGHTEAEAVEENRVEPTCTEDGSYDSVVYCSVCGDELSREEMSIDALGHTEAEAVEENHVDPTCTEEGSYDSVVYCSVCGEELSRDGMSIDALGHTEADPVVENRVEPTCLDKGSYDSVVYCSVCGDELSRESIDIDALGHDLINHEAQAPTCEGIGWDAYDTCSRCDYTTYVEIPAHGHQELDPVMENRVEPTCTEEGSYDNVIYCQTCGKELVRKNVVIPELGHDVVEHEAQAPTCTGIGWDAYETCKRCDYTTYVEIGALGHKAADAVVEDRVEPDCVNKGSYDSVVYCSVCGEELSRETIEIDALGHKAADAVVENRVEPDCLDKGSFDSVVYCSVCGEELSRKEIAIDALGHDIVKHDAKAPTCTEKGWDAYDTCSRCPYNTYVEKAALGHKTATKEENRVEPTCTKEGSFDSVVYCTVCNTELSREKKTIAAAGHTTVKHKAQAPTCTEIGWDAYETCAKCDYTTYVEKAALGHATVNHDAKAPTCTEIGWDAYDTCSRCDYTTYVEKAALGHSYDNNCDTNCNTCDEARTVPAHIYYNACDTTCNECGVARTVTEHSYEDCFKDYEVVLDGEWTISADETGVYIITLKDASEYNVHDIAVFDREGYKVVYNEKFGGWPLVGGLDYTIKFKYDCDAVIGETVVWELSSIGKTIFADTNANDWYNDAVTYAVGRGVIGGYDNGMFGTSDSIQRQDFLVMLARLDGADLSKYANQDSIFPDVAKDCYYEAAVIWGTEKGIVGGYDNGKFGVGDRITREQLVTFLYRYANYKGLDTKPSEDAEKTASATYSDFKNVSSFAKEPVLWAIENGIIKGKTATSIAPQGNAQRCEVAQIIYNIFLNDIL